MPLNSAAIEHNKDTVKISKPIIEETQTEHPTSPDH
jgi:hypothetical protein